MKVSASKVDAYIAKPDSRLLGALVYGPDAGLVSQRAEKLAKLVVDDLKDPFRVVDLTNDKLKEDPAILSDEMAAMSLGGGRRLVRFRDVGTGSSTIFKAALENTPESLAKDVFVLVTAGELSASSGIRKLFETLPNVAALPCYHDDARSLSNVLTQELAKYGLGFEQEVIPYLSARCQGDRLIALREVEKLSLYMGDKTHVSLEDTMMCVGETTESTLDDICHAVACGNQHSLEHHLRKALQQGTLPIVILRAVQRYFVRLHSVIGMLADGMAEEQALRNLKPPVFFKQAPVFKADLSKWKGPRSKALWRVLDRLYQAELACKHTGANSNLLCSRHLMSVASLANKKISRESISQ